MLKYHPSYSLPAPYCGIYPYLPSLDCWAHCYAVGQFPPLSLILVMVGVLESIVNFAQGGQLTEWLAYRFEAPFTIASDMVEGLIDDASFQVFDIVAIGNFVPAFLSRINWTEMLVGCYLPQSLFTWRVNIAAAAWLPRL